MRHFQIGCALLCLLCLLAAFGGCQPDGGRTGPARRRRVLRRRQQIRELMMLSDEPPNRRFRLYQSFRRRRRTTASTTTATTTTTTTTTEPPVAVSPALLNDERQQIPESDRSREISFHDRPAVAVDNSVFEDILTDASSSVVAPALGVQHDEDEFNGIDDATLTDASAGANVTDFSEVRAAPVQILDGQMRLVGGRTENEGNLEIFHLGEWGSVCDDEWDAVEAKIACKQMGFPGAVGPTHSSQFGYARSKIWIDNIYCYGTEKQITDCRFDGWGIHDCQRTEAAGVRCHERLPPTTTPPPPTTPKPRTPIADKHPSDIHVRITGGRVKEEGRVEVRLDGTSQWRTICGDGWGVREAMVVCREVGLGYVQSALQTHLFTNATAGDNVSAAVDPYLTQPLLAGVSCLGNEESLYECGHDADVFCPGGGDRDVAAVVCVDVQADLEPNTYELMTSAHLEDKQLFFLQCAMEENCLASEAYRLRHDRYDYATEMRRLLRFTASTSNVGNADFKPFIPKESWIWHGCHQHYHSMEVFAHYDVLDSQGQRVAEGHKASFCLEDNHCDSGVDPKYDCENYGAQGISAGCKDIYYYNIDCQWIDVTEMPLGTYTFKLAVNPEYKVAEQTFENNAAVCTLVYTEMYATIRNCTLTRP